MFLNIKVKQLLFWYPFNEVFLLKSFIIERGSLRRNFPAAIDEAKLMAGLKEKQTSRLTKTTLNVVVFIRASSVPGCDDGNVFDG